MRRGKCVDVSQTGKVFKVLSILVLMSESTVNIDKNNILIDNPFFFILKHFLYGQRKAKETQHTRRCP